MKKTKNGLNFQLQRHKLLILLCSLIGLLLIFPFIEQQFAEYLAILEIFFSLILITGIYAVSDNKQLITIVILLAILTFTVIWFNFILQSRDLLITALLLEVIFFSLTTAIILVHVLQYRKVTADKIYGVICVYLLIGIVWALIYATIETITPGSFGFVAEENYFYATSPYIHPVFFTQFMYFSFVTLATLGYGDITPATSIARAFASMEAVVGQLYIAILVARLVGLHISHTILEHYSDNKKLFKNSKE